MQTSPAGRAAIARREGNVLKAYLDSVGVLTIGVGHTSAAGPPKVVRGMTITAAESDAILARDLAGVEASVNALVKVPLNQNEFDALVSLVFNIGADGFKSSSVLRNLNAGNRAGAADAMLAWNKGTVGGKKVALAGLTTRRKDERGQFLTPAPQTAPPAPVQPAPAPVAPPAAPEGAQTSREEITPQAQGAQGVQPQIGAEKPREEIGSPSSKKTAGIAAFLVLAAAAAAGFWHHITEFVSNLF